MGDDQILKIFQQSSLEQLTQAEASLLRLESAASGQAPALVEAVFRAFHTVKGDAATFKLEAFAHQCHEVESILTLLRSGSLGLSSSLVSDLLERVDALKAEVSALGGPDRGSPEEDEPPPPEPAAEDQNTLAVQTAALDTLMERVGEILLLQSRLVALAGRDKRPEYLAVAEELLGQATQLGKAILDLRLMPIGVMSGKYRRLVRDLANQAGKQVTLTLSGESTGLDKDVIDKLNTPLIHLLRNAVRHGVELPAERKRRGKPETGTVTLEARQEGHDIVLTVSDDGAGIDDAAVLRRAVAAGLVDPLRTLDERERLDLIFLPGLSTSREVDEVSGRGVGLDAVQEAVKGLRGSVEVCSRPEVGAVFTIRFPVSLSMLECLRVSAGGEIFHLPLEAVERCLESPALRPAKGTAFGTFPLDGSAVPYVALDLLFGFPPGTGSRRQVVVVRQAGGCFGVVVDEVLGMGQVMIKEYSRKVVNGGGFLGATVTEAGLMSLIVDPRDLARRVQGRIAEQPAASRPARRDYL